MPYTQCVVLSLHHGNGGLHQIFDSASMLTQPCDCIMSQCNGERSRLYQNFDSAPMSLHCALTFLTKFKPKLKMQKNTYKTHSLTRPSSEVWKINCQPLYEQLNNYKNHKGNNINDEEE